MSIKVCDADCQQYGVFILRQTRCPSFSAGLNFLFSLTTSAGSVVIASRVCQYNLPKCSNIYLWSVRNLVNAALNSWTSFIQHVLEGGSDYCIFKSFEFVFGTNRCTPPSSPSSHLFVRSRGTGNTTVLAVAVCEWAAKGRCIIHGASFQSCDVRDTPAGTNTGVPGDSEPQPRYLETIPHLISLNSLAKR